MPSSPPAKADRQHFSNDNLANIPKPYLSDKKNCADYFVNFKKVRNFAHVKRRQRLSGGQNPAWLPPSDTAGSKSPSLTIFGIALWCNGSTSDSGSACEGSNPSKATMKVEASPPLFLSPRRGGQLPETASEPATRQTRTVL